MVSQVEIIKQLCSSSSCGPFPSHHCGVSGLCHSQCHPKCLTLHPAPGLGRQLFLRAFHPPPPPPGTCWVSPAGSHHLSEIHGGSSLSPLLSSRWSTSGGPGSHGPFPPTGGLARFSLSPSAYPSLRPGSPEGCSMGCGKGEATLH